MTLHAVLTFGSIVLAAMQLLSNWLLKNRNRAGWALTVTMNVIGLPYDWFTSQYGYIALTALNLPVAVKAWLDWGAAPRADRLD